MTTPPTHVRLVKITLLAAFVADRDEPAFDAGMAALGDQLAEMVRDGEEALTVAAEYDSLEADIPAAEDDAALDALTQAFPQETLSVGPVPGTKVLGRNGTFKKAHLTRTGDRIELWLGTPQERYPLVSIPVTKTRPDGDD
jgi:hypothetical protein